MVRPEKLPEADLSIYPFQDFSFSQENISRVYTYAQILPAIYIVGINIADLSALLMGGGGGITLSMAMARLSESMQTIG